MYTPSWSQYPGDTRSVAEVRVRDACEGLDNGLLTADQVNYMCALELPYLACSISVNAFFSVAHSNL